MVRITHSNIMEGTKKEEMDIYWRNKKKFRKVSGIWDKALEGGWMWTGGNESGGLWEWNPSTEWDKSRGSCIWSIGKRPEGHEIGIV